METGQINLELAPVDLPALLVEELVAARRRYPLTHYSHDLAEEGAEPPVTTDADRVRQVVGNLLDNAARHGGEAPSVVLSTSRAAGGRTAIRVRDNGPGIPPELRGQIFRRLRGASGAGGLGLGLYISKQIAGRLGGDLTFQTSAAGTEFVFTLPVNGPEHPPEGNGRSAAPSTFPRHDLPRPSVGSR
jgi:signal transduction histidine kinase